MFGSSYTPFAAAFVPNKNYCNTAPQHVLWRCVFFWLWLVSLVSAFDFPWQLCGLGCSKVEGQEIQLLFLCLFDSLLFSYFLSFFLCCHQGRSQKVAITRIAGLTTKPKTETETATETKTEYKALAIVTTPTSPRSE